MDIDEQFQLLQTENPKFTDENHREETTKELCEDLYKECFDQYMNANVILLEDEGDRGTIKICDVLLESEEDSKQMYITLDYFYLEFDYANKESFSKLAQ